MKKLNKVLALLCAGVVAGSVGAMAGCNVGNDDTHKHNYTYTKVDDTNHKGVCQNDGCDNKEVTEAHNWGTDNKCTKCDATKTETPATPTVTGVTISGEKTATVGDEVQLTATVAGTGNPAQTVTWTKVSGEGAVSADGKVTATAAGEVKVKATSTVDTSKSGEYTVTFAAPEVKEIAFDKEYAVLEDNEESELATATFTLANAQSTTVVESSDPTIATVAIEGETVTVTAVKTGKVTITATEGDTTKTATVEVASYGLTYALSDIDGADVLEVAGGDNTAGTLSSVAVSGDVYIPGFYYDEITEEMLPVAKVANRGFVVSAPNGNGGYNVQATSGITSVYLGDEMVIVGDNAFSKISTLKSFQTGKKTKSLGGGCFDECEALDTIEWAEDGVLETIGSCCFRFSKITEFIVPESVRNFNYGIFQGCGVLETFKCYAPITIIYNDTFLNASNLKTVYLPSTLTEIQKWAFGGYTDDSYPGNTSAGLTVNFAGTEEQWNNVTISSDLNPAFHAHKDEKLHMNYNVEY